MEKNKIQFHMIGAVLFILTALSPLTAFFRSFASMFDGLLNGHAPRFALLSGMLVSLLMLAGFVLIVIALFQKKRDKLLVLGFALIAAASLLTFALGFANGAYIRTIMKSKKKVRSFQYGYFVTNILRLIVDVGVLAAIAAVATDCLAKWKETVKKLWFVPAIAIAVMGFIGLIAGRMGAGFFFNQLFKAVAVLCTMIWLTCPDFVMNIEQKTAGTGYAYGGTAPQSAPQPIMKEADGYFDLVLHIVLLLFTCGIWQLIWVYRTTDYLNCVEGEQYRNPVTKLLLFLFIPFYSIYWTYISAQRIDKLAASRGVMSNLATLCLVLEIFIPIVPPILMQEKLNTILKGNDMGQQQTASSQPKTSQPVADVPEELKKYKELLDSGVITQEEFDEKKKQLLGL